jgi:hypothetical protein
MAEDSRSSREEKLQPEWVRLLIPSVADVFFIALLLLLVFTSLSVRLVGDAGIGWHIRTGQEILAKHAVPRVDLFSSTMHGKPWFAWEWMYDALVGWLENAAGLNGVVWFTAFVIATVFAWTFRLLIRRGTSVLLAFALVLLAASASMIHFLARPHVVTWLFAVACFSILDSAERNTTRTHSSRIRKLWLLPALMLIWVNMHGGFLFALVLLAIYGASAVWQWISLKDTDLDELLPKLRAGRRAKTLAQVSLLTVAATVANPYGWRLHVHIYHYLSNRFLMDHIDEFQSPNFHGVAQRCFAILLMLAMVALATRARELRLSEGLIVLFAVYAGLYASRNIPVSSLLLVLVSGPLLSDFFRTSAVGRPFERFTSRMSAMERGLRGHLWPIAVVLSTAAIMLNGGKVASNTVMDAHFDSHRFPEQAVQFLEQRHSSVPVLSPDYWGGYLIYRLYPETLVILDDRHDLYGEAILKSYLTMVNLRPGWRGFLRDQGVGCVVLPAGSPLASILKESPAWTVTHSDDVAVVFVRDPAVQF